MCDMAPRSSDNHSASDLNAGGTTATYGSGRGGRADRAQLAQGEPTEDAADLELSSVMHELLIGRHMPPSLIYDPDTMLVTDDPFALSHPVPVGTAHFTLDGGAAWGQVFTPGEHTSLDLVIQMTKEDGEHIMRHANTGEATRELWHGLAQDLGHATFLSWISNSSDNGESMLLYLARWGHYNIPEAFPANRAALGWWPFNLEAVEETLRQSIESRSQALAEMQDPRVVLVTKIQAAYHAPLSGQPKQGLALGPWNLKSHTTLVPQTLAPAWPSKRLIQAQFT
ncbi:hypothetical protein C8Q79DRAFT_928945 [Trametes meyenii]|nr:hypothetical protein C8Q79DRAFT_928945 [Trametes meyenii]